MPLKGIAQVKLNLDKKIHEISEERTHKAVYAVASQGRAWADTLTPVDDGNLLRSGYAPEIEKTSSGMRATVGYTARYAAAVHNAPGTLKGQPRAHFGKTSAGVEFGGGSLTGNYWDPNAEPKFLEKGFEKIKPKIPAILKEVYKK